MLRILSLGFGSILLCSAAVSANPQLPCAERSKIADRLQEHFGEEVRAVGMSETGTVIEVYVSPERTWTMLVSLPDGKTCMVQAGEAWEWVPREANGKTSDLPPGPRKNARHTVGGAQRPAQ